MEFDGEGFLYPRIIESKCINCGRCKRVCPALRNNVSIEPKMVIAAKAKDDILRLNSSSGGIFSLLATKVIDAGGVVFGAAIDEFGVVRHIRVENVNELKRLQGSKYVQSDVGDSFCKAKDDLVFGRQVLFSGTPCQIAGFRHFLGEAYRNLLCVDIVCHAVPSPRVWQRYLECLEAETQYFQDISFRDKSIGWRKYSMRFITKLGKKYCAAHYEDPFLKGFSLELYSRPSCYKCPVRGMKSGADITLGDFWHVWDEAPLVYDDRGVSLVLLNTSKGAASYAGIKGEVVDSVSNYNVARRVNPCLEKNPIVNPKRAHFFELFSAGVPFDEIVARISRIRFVSKVFNRLRKVLQTHKL